MNAEAMAQVIDLVRTALPQYEYRRTESRGDFSGRDVTIDVFGMQGIDEQKAFLRNVRPLQDKFHALLGTRPIFLFRGKGVRPEGSP